MPVITPGNNPNRNQACNCGNCIHFDGTQFCLRYPPQMVAQGNQAPNIFWSWPQTNPTLWCGEWNQE